MSSSLYFLMGFRRFSHAFSAIVAALQASDLAAARRALAAWRGGEAGELASGGDRAARDRARTHRCVSAGVRRRCSGSCCCPGRRARCSTAPRRSSRMSGGGSQPGVEPRRSRRPARLRPAGARAALISSTGCRCDSPRCRSPSSAISRTPSPAGARRRTVVGAGGRPCNRHPAGERRGRARRAARWRRCRCWSASRTCRPELGIGEPAEPELLPSRGGPRLARARAVAAADPAAHAREPRAVRV